jgi:tetratricopeptide (TPR) repeat protein
MPLSLPIRQLFTLALLTSGLILPTPQAIAADAATSTDAATTENTAPASATQGLSADFIFKYLTGEVAGQRGELGLASTLFFELAKSSRDPRLAERAAKAAIFGNQPAVAVQAVSLWSELDPESVDAQQTTVQMLVGTGRLAETMPYLEKLLAKEDTRANGFLYLHSLFGRQSDKTAVLTIVQELATQYPDLPEAHFAVAQAAAEADRNELALEELKQAEKLRKGWELAAMLHGQILFIQSPDAAINYYQVFLKKNADAHEIRLSLARLLVNQKRFDEAKVEFVRLAKFAEGNPEILVVIGLLSFQSGAFEDANKYFQQALTTDYQDKDQVYLYLGHNAEKQRNDAQAMDWYSKVQPGERYLDAKLNIAYVLTRTESTDAAIDMLKKLNGLHSAQQATVNQAIASLLTQAKRTPEAYALLEQTVNTLPNTPEIIYDFAMAAERLQKLDVMERELRKLIQIKPDYAPAYNALGYSFADRNIHLDEAYGLIEKALLLSPNDHYIMDSMGWVYYRMGSMEKALDYLQKAYRRQTDPEIAAHLGEVLWQTGMREEAIKTWEEALQTHPENEILVNTSKRFLQ